MDKRFCYLTPSYPQEAFLSILFLFNGQQITIFPVHEVLTSVDLVAEYIPLVVSEFGKHSPFVEISEQSVLIPMNLTRLFELKPEYWHQQAVPYTMLDKMNLYSQLALRPELHQLLVLPREYNADANTWQFTNTLPLSYNTDNSILEKFMKLSPSSADERAQYAGIYSLDSGHIFNWKSQEFVEKEQASPTPSILYN